MKRINKLKVMGTSIFVDGDFICITDMSKNFGGLKQIENWLRRRQTVEFLGIWEIMYNPDFNSLEFEGIRNRAGSNTFLLSVKTWINKTRAMGVKAKTGRYNSGTYAHKDIAFEFGSWLNPEFKLYLIKEFQRLKDEESRNKNLNWDLHRTLAKVNYKIHTAAVAKNLIPPEVTSERSTNIFAEEADLINVALFGQTAKEWRDKNSGQPQNVNMRDDATVEQLLVLANLETLNAQFIDDKMRSEDRLVKLNRIARQQLQALLENPSLQKVKQLGAIPAESQLTAQQFGQLMSRTKKH